MLIKKMQVDRHLNIEHKIYVWTITYHSRRHCGGGEQSKPTTFTTCYITSKECFKVYPTKFHVRTTINPHTMFTSKIIRCSNYLGAVTDVITHQFTYLGWIVSIICNCNSNSVSAEPRGNVFAHHRIGICTLHIPMIVFSFNDKPLKAQQVWTNSDKKNPTQSHYR